MASREISIRMAFLREVTPALSTPSPPGCVALLTARPRAQGSRISQRLREAGELEAVGAGEDREAAPGLRVEVLVVEVEGGGVALPLPLVLRPEGEEAA